MVLKMGNRYVVSDLHGQLNLYNQIKEYINDDDIVYALGDFGDRGPYPWLTLKKALDDPQFIYLMGNHDLMLINYIKKVLVWKQRVQIEAGKDIEWCSDDIPYWFNDPLIYNGGWETICGWADESASKRMEYYEKLLNAPLEIRVATRNLCSFIYLTHAGRNTGEAEALDVEDFVWDRSHFLRRWEKKGEDILIFGHTPQKHVKKRLKEVNSFLNDESEKLKFEEREGCLFFDDGNKICIDRGAHFTGETVLFNIDTLKGKVFKTEVKEIKE